MSRVPCGFKGMACGQRGLPFLLAPSSISRAALSQHAPWQALWEALWEASGRADPGRDPQEWWLAFEAWASASRLLGAAGPLLANRSREARLAILQLQDGAPSANPVF